jgi:signal transduction histidine kinase
MVQIGVALLPVYLIGIGIYHMVLDFRWKYAAFLLANVGILSALMITMSEELGVVQNLFLQENATLVALVLDFSVLTCVIGFDFYRLRIDNQQLSNSLSEALIEGGQQFVEGQQRERTRLAQELHDGASSRLSALQMRMSTLVADDDALKQSLVKETRVIAQDIRRFSHNLSSVVLERYGFVNAIEELLYSIEESETGFEVEFNYGEDAVDSKSIERELYFITLELINNGLKYSTGDHLLVEFKVSGTHYELQVNDNGEGYYVDPLGNASLGMKGINWRLKLLKGELAINYSDGYQCHRVKIPRY